MSTRHTSWMLLLSAALLAGCGQKQTIETPEGTVTQTTTTEGDDSRTVVETPQGTTEVTKEGETTTMTTDADGKTTTMTHQAGGSELTAKDIGVEFYPGAEATMSNVWSSGPTTTNMVQLTSADDPDKIMKFYEDQLGKVDHKSTQKTDDGGLRTLIKMDGKIHHNIAIQTVAGKSTVTISRVENADG